MSRAVIIYKSETGFTERYARWLAEALGCEAVPYARRDTLTLSDYDLIVYGGWAHAGQVAGVRWLKRRLPALTRQRVAVFVVGGTPAGAEEERALKQCFAGACWKNVGAFYLPGGFRYERMSPWNRLLMRLFRAMVKREQGEESEMYRMLGSSYDLSNQAYLAPLAAWCQEG